MLSLHFIIGLCKAGNNRLLGCKCACVCVCAHVREEECARMLEQDVALSLFECACYLKISHYSFVLCPL